MSWFSYIGNSDCDRGRRSWRSQRVSSSDRCAHLLATQGTRFPLGVEVLESRLLLAFSAGPVLHGSQAAWVDYDNDGWTDVSTCLLYTSPSPRDGLLSRMPSSA